MKGLFMLTMTTLFGRRRRGTIVEINGKKFYKIKLSRKRWQDAKERSRERGVHPCVALGCYFSSDIGMCQVECTNYYFVKYENR